MSNSGRGATPAEVSLRVEAVSVAFGALNAVRQACLTVERGQVVGLVGPNGAGKTTLFDAITGHVRLLEGRISLRDSEMSGLPVHSRARLGVARTFQLGGVIADLTVGENIALGIDHRSRHAGGWAPSRRVREDVRWWLQSFDLQDFETKLIRDLSQGVRREVEILRAIASGAELVLLDEPGVGLTASEKRKLVRTIRNCADDGKSFLVTDHDTDIIFDVSDVVYAMSFGQIIASGDPRTVRANPDVIATYLGRGG